ncbi:winged helix-turn-helix domain-containing protein [Brevundimonas sp. PAMC22021]|uniref:winged helix-turn-helix domain-containing protein n=1 Tax=Brevundimonas sp. PAMC22021 TaxID=2861285 RepID=UPI001C630142|nr:LysR family transcriptional regulator [Brevundimonas sp. PAMC22021]QYF87392.1 LysR family transcriptional regulator [Brevundimonas sp. PAMC22021]
MSGQPLELWFRLRGADGAIGPGKVRLLQAVRDEGSLSAAARKAGVSYRRAWQLLDEASRAVGQRLIETSQGGVGGGGARLTSSGEAVLREFQQLETVLEAAAEPALRRLANLDGD